MTVWKRLLDIAVAICALAAVVPLLLIAAIGIKLTSAGPILYRAQRIGRDRRQLKIDRLPAQYMSERRQADRGGRAFTMYKLRTMRIQCSGAESPIAAMNDVRVFPFGAWLRQTKIDELPQLLNVIKGDMSLVGPRPEAPEIVRNHYTADDRKTLQVSPGLTSPGSIYYYTHCETMLAGDNVQDQYVRHLLPIKLALDRSYIRNASVVYDVRLILRTIVVVTARSLGRERFATPPELARADVPPPIPR
jgi:lipopolysaccharide/colanic/teichoic acid biosynthesis glycosyltransferase